MATANLATEGFGTGTTVAQRVRESFIALAGVNATIATEGFGAGSTIAGRVREGFNPYPGVPYPPPAGKAYLSASGLPWAVNADSIFANASPAVANGDLTSYDQRTLPNGYLVVMRGDGTYQILRGGDASRQSFVCDVFDVSANAWYGVFTTWDGNQSPQQTGSLQIPQQSVGRAIVPISVASVSLDPEADALTFTLSPNSLSALPDGLTFNASTGLISGTPTTAGITTIIPRATDAIGDGADMAAIQFDFAALVTVPNVRGLNQAGALAALTGAGFLVSITTANSATVTNGLVIDQSESAGSQVPAGTSIQITVSLGTGVLPVNYYSTDPATGSFVVQESSAPLGLSHQTAIQYTAYSADHRTVRDAVRALYYYIATRDWPPPPSLPAGSSLTADSTIRTADSTVYTADQTHP